MQLFQLVVLFANNNLATKLNIDFHTEIFDRDRKKSKSHHIDPFRLKISLHTIFLFQSIFEGYIENIRKCNYSRVEGCIIHTYINASKRMKFMIDHRCHLSEYVNGGRKRDRKKNERERENSTLRKEE